MYCVNSLRHNSFKKVDVPSPSDMYKKMGFGVGTQKTSGDEVIDTAESKVTAAQKVQKIVDEESAAAEQALKEKEEKEK